MQPRSFGTPSFGKAMKGMSSTQPRIALDVPVEPEDLDAAADFYKKAFDLEAAPERASGVWNLRLGPAALRVCSPSSCRDSRYRMGEVPRLELRVQDVDVYVGRFVDLGASLRCRLFEDRSAAEDEPSDYAQLLDPFGHLWSFAKEPPR